MVDAAGDSDLELDAGDAFAGLISSLKATKRIRKPEKEKRPVTEPVKVSSQPKRRKTDCVGAVTRGQEQNGSGAAADQEATHAERLSFDPAAAPDTFAEHFGREAVPVQRAADGPFTLAFSGARSANNSSWAMQGTPIAMAPVQLQAYSIKERLQRRWADVAAHKPHAAVDAEASGGCFVDGDQAKLFAVLNSYRDITMPTHGYPNRVGAQDAAMDAVLLHCLNHCNKAADAIKRGNEQLKGAPKGSAEAPRDQGFTRPKVLILLPFRNAALGVVLRLAALAQAETRTDSVQHKERFVREFGDEDGASPQDASAAARKPAEHQALFAGNCDDHFRLGIKLTRGAVRLYSEFLQSDVIVASPLGLTTLLTEAAGAGDAGAADFLTSIEIAVVARGDVLLMQNWMHVTEVFSNLNALPKVQTADVMRVRPAYLNGQAQAFRQTVVLSSFAFPEVSALFAQRCSNWAGRAIVRVQHQGVLSSIMPQLRQVFERIGSSGLGSSDGGSGRSPADARFEHFRTIVWPRLLSGAATGQLLFVSSYFDYVRVRNFLQAEAAEFAQVSEYAGHSEAARARSHFADGRAPLLLYTERAHFYHRHRLRGIRDVVFYQLPVHAGFYAELVNAIGSSTVAAHATVATLFAPEDAGALERVVGSSRSRKMLKNTDTPTYMFC